MQKKELSYEFLREQAHLRARTRLFSAVLRVRDAAQYGLVQYFKVRARLTAGRSRPAPRYAAMTDRRWWYRAWGASGLGRRGWRGPDSPLL